MAIELEDGSVLPHYIGTRNPSTPRDPGTHTNMSLRFGEVVDIIYPTDERSITKTVIEYKVNVTHSDNYNATITTSYFAVPVGNMFGGVADFTNYTLRKAENNQNDDSLDTLSNGSKVLLLCINGRTSQAIIIGGVHDPDQPNDDQEDGHNLKFQFNGINATINDDGEIKLTYTGASKIDGTLRDGVEQDKTGGYLQLDKEGNFTGEVPNNIILKSMGVLTGDATDKTILGTTYRDAEHEMNTQLAGALSALGGQMTALQGSLQSAASGLIPTASSSAASLQVASTLCASMQGQLNQAVQAIQSFEANASAYLSKKNLSD